MANACRLCPSPLDYSSRSGECLVARKLTTCKSGKGRISNATIAIDDHHVDQQQSWGISGTLWSRTLWEKSNSLTEIAKSPIRLNPTHDYTVFRVRMGDLAPRTTYYYTVDSMEANGAGRTA